MSAVEPTPGQVSATDVTVRSERSGAAQVYVLPSDVVFTPMRELSAAVRDKLDGREDDVAITRPGFRVPSRLVDESTATLLEEFRVPSTIADAVLRYCRARDLDAIEVIDAAFPMLLVFSNSRILVPEGSVDTERAAASLAPGQICEGIEIVASIQSTYDTEVYKARLRCGRDVALKIESPQAPRGTERRLARERKVLADLADLRSAGLLSVPEVLRSGVHDGRRYLVSSWQEGVPLSSRANDIRHGASPGWRRRLHALACRTVDAFAHLHTAGFVHGDVHANNILVRDDDAIVLVDFGLSVGPGECRAGDDVRVGVTRLLDPLSAAAMSRAELPPAASAEAELYSLAGLLYELYTGTSYIEFAADVDTVYRQIQHEPPRPFVRCKVESWPEIEKVLHRALAKRPRDRYPGMRDFHRALRLADPPDRDARHEIFARQARRFVAPFVPCVESLATVRTLFPEAPVAALDRGCAGYAWFLYRLGQLRGSARLASMADVVARQAIEASTDRDAFHLPDPADDPVEIDSGSVLHRLPGLHYVHALICHSRGDIGGFRLATDRFLRSSNTDGAIADVSFGHAGTALALCNLLGASRTSPFFDGSPLAAALVRTMNKLETMIAGRDAPGLVASQPFSFAHGMTGVCHALLRGRCELREWEAIDRADSASAPCEATLSESTRASMVDWVRSCGDLLASGGDAATARGDAFATARDDRIPGWCNGAAGLVPFLLLAGEQGLHESAPSLAAEAALTADRHTARESHLCCGVAGRVFALLAMFRHSGEPHWLERARALGNGLLHPSLPAQSGGVRHSLFWGELGCALALEELQHPEQSVMPVFGDMEW